MTGLDLNPTPKKDNRMLAIGLAALAAALLVYAAFSRMWLGNPALEIGFGPLGCTHCGMFGGPDAEMSNSAFVAMVRDLSPSAKDEISGAFAPMGYATFGLCLLAVVGLVAAAGLALNKRRPELPMSPASLALLAIMIALVTGCIFVGTKPGGNTLVGIAIGFWAWAAGSILGLVSAQMLAKEIRPVDPDLLADSMNPDAY